MNSKSILLTGTLLLLAGSARAQTLSVTTDSVSYSGGIYSYDYVFQFNNTTGGAPVTVANIYLSSDDLSPADLTYKKDGVVSNDWSFATAGNYLVFGSATDSLGNGDMLEVTFDDSAADYVPKVGAIAVATDVNFSAFTPRVANLISPSAVPEPGGIALVSGMLVGGVGLARPRRRRGCAY